VTRKYIVINSWLPSSTILWARQVFSYKGHRNSGDISFKLSCQKDLSLKAGRQNLIEKFSNMSIIVTIKRKFATRIGLSRSGTRARSEPQSRAGGRSEAPCTCLFTCICFLCHQVRGFARWLPVPGCCVYSFLDEQVSGGLARQAPCTCLFTCVCFPVQQVRGFHWLPVPAYFFNATTKKPALGRNAINSRWGHFCLVKCPHLFFER